MLQSLRGRIIVIKKLIVILACFVLIVLLANTIFAPSPRTPWYQVEHWEEEVCSKWGGTQFSGQEAVTSGRKISFAKMTATAQAKKFKTPENFYLYEIAYYIDSFAELIDYELVLTDPAKPDLRHRILSGSLAPEAGTMGYEVYNLTDDYSELVLKYTGGSVTTQIIEVR